MAGRSLTCDEQMFAHSVCVSPPIPPSQPLSTHEDSNFFCVSSSSYSHDDYRRTRYHVIVSWRLCRGLAILLRRSCLTSPHSTQAQRSQLHGPASLSSTSRPLRATRIVGRSDDAAPAPRSARSQQQPWPARRMKDQAPIARSAQPVGTVTSIQPMARVSAQAKRHVATTTWWMRPDRV